ncbi:hypothetical protein FB45DRAFT_864555 [Roridomyces roridus]|uniref:Uncharacterized protein n=1 Tax=Roridomyces roridus TaxID=1738132 RepID=A0AAD7FPR6_9AGAR|nr:hypothetical protein FB45DRAFT_864555 [Roridomyces roridus]
MPFLSSSRMRNVVPGYQPLPTGIHSLPSELLAAIFNEVPRPFFLDADHSRWAPSHKSSAPRSGQTSGSATAAQGSWPPWTNTCVAQVGFPLDIAIDIEDTIEYLDNLPFWQAVLRVWEHVGGGSVDAPLLKSLTLFAVGNEMLSGVASITPRVGGYCMHFDGLPMLKALVLHGVELETDTSLFPHRLEIIDVSSVGGSGILASLAEQFHSDAEDLPLMPSLRHLTLRGSHIPESAAVKSYLSHLTRLTLGHVNAITVPSLSRIINASLLEELSLENLTNAFWRTFSIVQMTFPVLHTLTLSSNSIAGRSLPGLDGIKFPALRRLRLNNFVSCSILISELGVSPLESSIQPPWPTLTDLTVTGDPDYRAMRALVDTRRAMGVPIRSLTVDSPRFLDAGALNWLKKNVEEFTRLVPNHETIKFQVPEERIYALYNPEHF